ncbi:peptidase [Vibrio parahaemolyticus]|uniref:Peptidase n=1 Tax=Vibrio parahaemolyticus TaxID=670 RepID=A0A8H9MYT1_VIBPH|nr:peptidase [Vibrio parahaemolyticus]HAS6672768.1 peptidase [Vibrio parahaemolyticus]HAS6674843.1 peptidase [Vibrio parahaemolyticus]HAS6678621.1 peptidase [Vibrio parahaemolyticus]HAS6680543.1 peptidase [Vibrio parahaemolyticus]
MKDFLAVCFNLSKTVIDGLGEEQGANAVWLPMIPAGEVTGRDGRTWMNSNPDGIVAAFDAQLPFDIEHATEIRAQEGKEADAAGWILAVENRDGEIWAQVEWTYLGRYKITDKLYKYYSPAFTYNKEGVITSMSSAGLTNKPNFFVPALNRQEEDPMKLSKLICDALGLSEDATEQDALTAINTLQSEKEVALNRAKTPDLNLFVPIGTHEVALNRAKKAEDALAAINEKEVEALVQAAIDDGKVAPADKEMYVGLCSSEKGREQFEKFVEGAPQIATNRQVKVPKKEGEPKLEEHELAFCRKMGVTEEEFLASKQNMNVGAK